MKRKIKIILGAFALFLVIIVSVWPVLAGNQSALQPPAINEFSPADRSSGTAKPPSEATLATKTGNSPAGEVVQLKSLVLVEVYRPVGGKMVQVYQHESSNVITNVGLYALSRHLGGQTGAFQWTAALGGNDRYYRSTAPTYIAISSDSTGVDAIHTSWQAVDGSYPADIEITGGGLDRATGTLTIGVAYTAGSGGTKGSHTYSLSRTFTVAAGSSFTAVQKAGLFNNAYNTNDGSSSGQQISALVAENTFAPVDLNAGDQIAVTWRITL